jgi:predicted S18 family serine protease
MNLQDLQNLSLDKRQKIFYAVVIISAVILFSFWINDSLKRINQYSEKYKGQKIINSTANYSESMQRAKNIMDKVNKQMEQDLQKYDPEFQALEKMASSSTTTNTTSTTTTINIQ